ncbi:hypothetical protein CBR_g32571 [Chara braunii]|uniref:DUF659 domain-containing protein n=1 Tax=Chara braunii TaxID=69332 RepID=A0A388LGY3_CHABU|nr:hypothetical protein CBR_g32571 [Chara braunii]|eukprot:GBG81579.1 hypothetical protein CBR_g32571 [Chara braunii]
MGRAQRRQHEAAADHVQDTVRARSLFHWYPVVGQNVDNKGVIMLLSDEALYEIARRTQRKFEADQLERVARYAAERGLDVPGTGGARGGEAGRRPAEGGVGGDGGHGTADPTLGSGGGETEEGLIHVDREARGPGEEGVPEREDVPEFYPGTRERLEDLQRRAGQGAATEGSFKRKEGGSDPAATPAGKRLRQQKVTDVYELAEELEEVRQPFWVTGATFLSDGRKSRDGKPIVNFLAAGSRGVVVYTTINREGEADDVMHVLRRWVTIFHEFSFGGPQRINAICTDSASAYMGAARALTSPSIPPALRRITWLPCSVHMGSTVAEGGHHRPYHAARHGVAQADGCGGQYMSLMIEWTQDLVRRGTVACAPLGKSFAERIIRRVQARTQHMLEPAHCAGFLLNPCRRHVRYFSRKVERYDAWSVGQAKRYILMQTGFKLEGAEYILACRQFEDFHIQQGRFGDWGGPEGRARGRACSGDIETIECTSWWSQFMSGAPELQRCALRVMHMWSCASPVERNWAVHEGIHTKKRNQLAFENVVQLVEITANVRLTEYRRAGCGYVLPWQRDEGMLDCQAGLELEPVRSGTRRGMTEEEIARQEEGAPSAVAVESSVAPAAVPDATIPAAMVEIAAAAATSVLEEMAASMLEVDPPAAGGGTAVEGQVAAAGGAGGGATAVEVEVAAAVEEEEAPSAAAVEEEIAAQAEVQRGGDDERLMQQFLTEELGPAIAGMTPGVARGFGISDSEDGDPLRLRFVDGLPPSCGGAISTDRAPLRDEAPGQTSTQTARERTMNESPDAARDIMERERARLLASTDPRAQAFARAVEEARRREIGRDCVQGGVVAGEDIAEGVAAEPVPEAMQGGAEATDVAVEGRPHAVDEAVQAGQRQVEGAIDARREVQETATGDMPPPPPRAPAGDPSSSPTGRGSRSPHTPGRSRTRDTTAVQQDVCDTTIFGRTDIDLDSTRRVTKHTACLQPGLGRGGARTTAAREVPASGCEPQRGRGRGVSTETLEYALRAATRAVQEQTPRKCGVPARPRPVPAEGGATLGESSGAEGLGMPRGSRREQTIAEASARVVVLRKGGVPVTIEEDDPNTDAAVPDADEDYEGKEGGEENSRSGFDGDDDDDYDEPPPSPGTPPTRASRRSAARTSSSSRGRKRSTSDTLGGTKRHNGKGKKGR